MYVGKYLRPLAETVADGPALGQEGLGDAVPQVPVTSACDKYQVWSHKYHGSVDEASPGKEEVLLLESDKKEVLLLGSDKKTIRGIVLLPSSSKVGAVVSREKKDQAKFSKYSDKSIEKVKVIFL